MIKIYDDNRNLLISTNEYSNFSVLKEINQPDQFSIDTTEEIGDFIRLEGYIETKEGTFVIKEKSFANYYRIMGSQDLEDLDDFIEHKRFERLTLKEMIQGLVAPYGWTVVGDSLDKKTINVDNKTVINGVFDCINLFKYEIKFDNINKVIYIAKELGNDRGTYFHSDLNLKKITISSDSYDFATRIIPVGNEGLTIESVNNGKKYLENHKYSNKVKTIYWRDNRYHIPENLKATAEEMLENLAKPLNSLDCEIVNLVNNSKYSFLDFDIGDKVIIVDNNLKIKEKHRITSYLKYPNEPHRSVVTFENKPRDVIDRFTDIDYRFDNYDNKFDDYDFKFDDYDIKFDDYDIKFDDFNLKIDDLPDRLSVIEEMLGAGVSCVVIKSEDIVPGIIEDIDTFYLDDINIINSDYYGNCFIIPSDYEHLRFVNNGGFQGDVEIVGHKKIKSYWHMFATYIGNLRLSNFEITRSTSARNMFQDYKGILDLGRIDTSMVTDFFSMFINADAVPTSQVSMLDTRSAVNCAIMFAGSKLDSDLLNLSSWNTSNLKFVSYMFNDCEDLVNLDISGWNTGNIERLSGMFANCLNFKGVDMSIFNCTLPSIGSLTATFGNTPNWEGPIDISNIKVKKVIEGGAAGVDALTNCGASIVYVNNEEIADFMRREEVNPDGIPIAVK